MVLWSDAVSKVEKQQRGSQSGPVMREGVKRLEMQRRGGRVGV